MSISKCLKPGISHYLLHNITLLHVIHLTSTDDLENQSYILRPLVHHGLYTGYKIIFAVNLGISDVGNLKMTNICHLTSTVDLDIQGKKYFQMTFIISG